MLDLLSKTSLYILDGSSYQKYDGKEVRNVADSTVATMPVLYQNIQVGENATTGEELQQANLLNPYGIFTFIADGVTKEYFLPRNVKSVHSITVYGTEMKIDEGFTTSRADKKGFKIIFADDKVPKKPTEEGFSDSYAGVEVKADLSPAYMASGVVHCTLAEVFDNRVFLSGNPYYPSKYGSLN